MRQAFASGAFVPKTAQLNNWILVGLDFGLTLVTDIFRRLRCMMVSCIGDR